MFYTRCCACVCDAQVAKQEGEYLAKVLVTGQWDQQENVLKLPENAQPFK